MFRYRVYGLTLAAGVELPLNPCEASGPVDYVVDFSMDGGPLTERIVDSKPLYVSRKVVRGRPAVVLWKGNNEGEHLFRFYDGIAFVVDRERGLVACRCATEPQVKAAGHHLLFSLMGFLLASRNAMALHGAAIAGQDGVVALLGRPQSGKSMMAIELATSGSDVLSDELVAVRSNAGVWEVSRGYAWSAVRLAASDLVPGAATSLGLPWQYLDESYQSWVMPTSGRTTEALAIICILSPRAHGDPSIEDVSPREACIAVLDAAARTHIPFPDLARRELDTAAQLVSAVPARRLNYQVSNGGLARALHWLSQPCA